MNVAKKLVWIHGRKVIIRRLIHTSLAQSLMESPYASDRDYMAILEDNLEVSPQFFTMLHAFHLKGALDLASSFWLYPGDIEIPEERDCDDKRFSPFLYLSPHPPSSNCKSPSTRSPGASNLGRRGGWCTSSCPAATPADLIRGYPAPARCPRRPSPRRQASARNGRSSSIVVLWRTPTPSPGAADASGAVLSAAGSARPALGDSRTISYAARAADADGPGARSLLRAIGVGHSRRDSRGETTRRSR